MAFRKRSYRRKKRSSFRTMRRKMYRKRVRVPPVYVKRTQYTGAWTFGVASTSDFWKYETFTTGAINNFAELANVFDEYKINAIKVTYRPQYDTVASGTTAATMQAQPQAYMHYVIDPASATIPSGTYNLTSLNLLFEQPNVKTKTLNRPFSIYFKPKVLGQVYNTGTSATVERSPWVRTSDTSVQYRGYHAYIQQNNFSTANVGIRLDTYVTVYAQFRNLK